MNKLDIDPYFACLLISMAQNSCRFTSSDIIEVNTKFPNGILEMLTGIQVHLFSPSTNRESLIQHSVKFLRPYLQKLSKPHKCFDCHFTITRQKNPFHQPHLIVQKLHDIEMDLEKGIEKAGKDVSVIPIASVEREAMSDITNYYVSSPSAKLNTRTKRRRIEEDT